MPDEKGLDLTQVLDEGEQITDPLDLDDILAGGAASLGEDWRGMLRCRTCGEAGELVSAGAACDAHGLDFALRAVCGQCAEDLKPVIECAREVGLRRFVRLVKVFDQFFQETKQ